MTQVKICGVNSEAAFDAVVEAGAEYLGFVFFPPSPRFITFAQASTLNTRHQGGPKRVGLLVGPTDAEIAAVLTEVNLEVLQIYADSTRARDIKTKFGIPVWRAVGVATPADLPADDEGLDGFVIEAKPPPHATRPGGNAVTMDWSLLKFWRAPGFLLLGGGLNAQNMATAIAQSGAPGVDVSSGVETAPGAKSPAMIATFIAAARAA
jgi:phosphoribosylanthranilate isomerase